MCSGHLHAAAACQVLASNLPRPVTAAISHPVSLRPQKFRMSQGCYDDDDVDDDEDTEPEPDVAYKECRNSVGYVNSHVGPRSLFRLAKGKDEAREEWRARKVRVGGRWGGRTGREGAGAGAGVCI